MISSGYLKALFAALAIIYTLPYMQSVCMGVISQSVGAELRLDTRQMGLLGSTYLYAYALVQFFSGLIAAVLGPRKTLGVLLLVSAGGCVLFSQADGLLALCLGRAVTAMGMAVVLSCAITVFGRWYPDASYGRLCAWLFAIGGTGAFVGTMPFSVLNAAFGWRNVQMGMAVLTLGAAVLAFVAVRDWPGAQGTHSAPSLRSLLQALKQVAYRMDFWRLCLWYAFMSGTFYAFAGLWGGPYLIEVHRLSAVQVGAVLSMGTVGFVVGNPLMTWLCEKHLHSYRLGLGGACVLGLAGALLLVFGNQNLSLPSLYVASLLLGMAANAPNAVGYAAARSLFGTKLAGSIGGILGFSSFVGGAGLQMACGFLLYQAEGAGLDKAAGFALAFSLFIPCAVAAGWAGFTLSESFGRQPA